MLLGSSSCSLGTVVYSFATSSHHLVTHFVILTVSGIQTPKKSLCVNGMGKRKVFLQ